MPTRIRTVLPWVGLFVVSFAAFAGLRIHEDSRSAPQLAIAQPQRAQAVQAPLTDSEYQSTDQVLEFMDDQGSRDAGPDPESADLSDLTVDEDPSTREEAQALQEALAANADGSE